MIFVFSLENEQSFNAVYTYYTKMSHYRNCNEIPIILVGTQDAISERSPRIIDDSRARKLAADLSRRCSYYETCATYGLNVERVFHDGKHIFYILFFFSPFNSILLYKKTSSRSLKLIIKKKNIINFFLFAKNYMGKSSENS